MGLDLEKLAALRAAKQAHVAVHDACPTWPEDGECPLYDFADEMTTAFPELLAAARKTEELEAQIKAHTASWQKECDMLTERAEEAEKRAGELIRYGNALRGTHGEKCRYDRPEDCPAVTDWLEAVASTPAPLPTEPVARPTVVTFCGSSRFIEHMAILMWEFEKMGKITMGLHYLPAEAAKRDDGSVIEHHLAEEQGVAAQMDELHLRKIDLSDEVFVVNVDGYIGDSCRREIAYATAHGKRVRYLNPTDPAKEVE